MPHFRPVVMESAVRAMVDTDGDGYLRPTELANLAAIALGRAPTGTGADYILLVAKTVHCLGKHLSGRSGHSVAMLQCLMMP